MVGVFLALKIGTSLYKLTLIIGESPFIYDFKFAHKGSG